jgi:hypothetical protein
MTRVDSILPSFYEPLGRGEAPDLAWVDLHVEGLGVGPVAPDSCVHLRPRSMPPSGTA